MKGLTRAEAETTLESCQNCTGHCDECIDIASVLDSLMLLREISAYEDAEEMEIERLLAG